MENTTIVIKPSYNINELAMKTLVLYMCEREMKVLQKLFPPCVVVCMYMYVYMYVYMYMYMYMYVYVYVYACLSMYCFVT